MKHRFYPPTHLGRSTAIGLTCLLLLSLSAISAGPLPPAAPTGGSEGSGPPAWAQRMMRNQSMVHGAQTAAQVLRSGDSHGGGHSVDLSGGE